MNENAASSRSKRDWRRKPRAPGRQGKARKSANPVAMRARGGDDWQPRMEGWTPQEIREVLRDSTRVEKRRSAAISFEEQAYDICLLSLPCWSARFHVTSHLVERRGSY